MKISAFAKILSCVTLGFLCGNVFGDEDIGFKVGDIIGSKSNLEVMEVKDMDLGSSIGSVDNSGELVDTGAIGASAQVGGKSGQVLPITHNDPVITSSDEVVKLHGSSQHASNASQPSDASMVTKYGKPIALGVASVLELGFDIAYEVQENKNYQSFVNATGKPVRIQVSYHTGACPKDDIFELTADGTKKNILYPGACQAKTITVYQAGTDTLLGQRSLMVGQSGARHGNWELVKGAQGDQVFIRQSTRTFDPEYFQVIHNNLSDPINVRFSYLFCKDDGVLTIQPGGTAEGTPKGCLLKSVTIFDTNTNMPIAKYEVPAASSSQRHGMWQVSKAENGVVVIVPLAELVTTDEVMNYIADVGKKIGITGGALGVVAATATAATAAGIGTASAAAPVLAAISATGVGALALMATGAVLGAGVGLYYAVEADKNYQAFTNLTKTPLWIKITYHLSKAEDIFQITPGDHRIVYPATDNKKSNISVLQPSLITILDETKTKKLGSRSFNIGSDGGRHGDWQLVQGATADSIVVKERTMKGALQNAQWVENMLNGTVTVRFIYRSAFCPHDDVLTVAPGGNAQADPKGCLLKKIIADGDGKHFERAFNLAAPGTQHGSWRITPFGIEGPL